MVVTDTEERGGMGEWPKLRFSDAVLINPPVHLERGKSYPFVGMAAVHAGSRCAYAGEQRAYSGGGTRFRSGDTLMARITPCLENGKIARYCAPHSSDTAHGSTEFIVLRGRPAVTDSEFVYYLTQWEEVRHYAIGQMTGTSGRQRVPTPSLAHLTVTIPPLPEQKAIANALSDIDGLIGALAALITKKRAIKQAAMQQLLTGKTRLPGFSEKWETKRIAEIARYRSEKNSSDESLPVLTCSKHLGFVDSLRYFKNQVFSKDLSGYKIIKRGDIGYPANHVEEGSIGLQNLYDIALVSPIYVVCTPTEGVNSYFLHRLLKLESYRQKFATATMASIDRRGSLKWPAFSEIGVTLPPIEEQHAIAGVLSDMDAEIAALEGRRDKTHLIKQGMMQQLLTGRVRLGEPA